MRYKELTIDNKSIKNKTQIDSILSQKGFHWLIDSEIEDAVIEIKKDTIIWKSGNFYNGNWHYGIFQNGKFYGNFVNGIFENGEFNGNWESGINLQSKKDIKNNLI